MKKKISILLIICVFAMMATACGDKNEGVPTDEELSAEATVEETDLESAIQETQGSEDKQALDKYAALADEYTAIMEKYYSKVEEKGIEGAKDLRSEYKSLSQQFKDASKKLEARYNSMSSEDQAYYDKVKDGADQKVAKTMENHADAVQTLVEAGLK